MYCTGNYLTSRFQVRKLYSRKTKGGGDESDYSIGSRSPIACIFLYNNQFLAIILHEVKYPKRNQIALA